MPLNAYQQSLCRLIGVNRIQSGESYVAGGAALNELTGAARVSRDIDLFHDTAEALIATWNADRHLLEEHGYQVEVVRERAAYVEAIVSSPDGSAILQWTQDSAFRFFPLVEHAEFGLVLHPFDLATNKVLALIGRQELRDWIDTITCHSKIQRLGYLAWAACGKGPSFSPTAIIELASRFHRYTASELASLEFDGPVPAMDSLVNIWHESIAEAKSIVDILPYQHAGKAVLTPDGSIYNKAADDVERDIISKAVRFHDGSVRGAFPSILG